MKKKHSIFIRTLAGCVKDLASLVETRDSSEILNAASTFIMYLLGDRLSKDFLYFALPVWSFVNNNWRSVYPVWCRDGRNEKRYQKLKKIFQYDLDFSFTGFMAHKIKRIPRILNIQFEWDATERSRIYCAKSTVNPMEVVMSVPIRNNILNSAFLTGTGVAFDAEAKKFSQITQDDSLGGFLKVKNIDKLELEKFFRFLYCYARIYGRAIRSLFLISSNVYGAEDGDVGYGGLIIASSQKEPFKDSMDLTVSLAITINTVYSTIAISDWADFSNYRDRRNSTKSAIGSIMSRNGSHNIGSHVLAALSHNIGTLPDDRVLYQYIQHRMDYIATVTTDMPKWRQPMMFVGDLIKNFLSQRHLLDHIAGSEGLKAWQFQNTHADNRHCLKFHVRRMKCEGGVRTVDYDFIAYPEEKNNPENPSDKKNTEKKKEEIDLANDIALAIPGGVVGQHAFFTILENIIRNAAKHDWAVLHPATDKPTSDDDNLDIFIEFEDMPDAGVVEFVIYSSKSFATAKDETGKEFDLRARQNDRFTASLIDDQGALRRENWGLAEMKISAGYLQSREISEIGGLGVESDKTKKDQAKYGTIIEAVSTGPVREKDGQGNIIKSSGGYLGYRFKIPKPRTLLLVTESKDAITDTKRVQLQKEGIYILEKSELNGKDDLSYEFVLLPSFVESECKDWRLPFRLITMTSDGNWPLAKDLLAHWDVPFENFGGATEHNSKNYETVDAVVEGLCSGKLAPSALKNHIAACWTRYMLHRRPDIKGTLNLIVAPTIGDDSGTNQSESKKSDGSGKSLINPASVVTYVFEEGFDKAVDSYLKLEGIADASGQEKKSVHDILTALKGMKQRRVDDEVRQSDADYEPIICLQLLKWTKILGWADREIVAYLEARSCLIAQSELDSIDKKIADAEKRLRDAGTTDFVEDKDWSRLKFQRSEILKRARRASFSASHSFSHFISYFVEVCRQAKGYLGKYAENIPTLPKGYEIRTGSDTVSPKGIVASEWSAADLMVCHGNRDCKDAPSVRYIRHFEQKDGVSRVDRDHAPEFVEKPFACFAGTVHYVEGLSGTQSYLSQLLLLDLYNRCYQSKLVENALMRLLIVDERVSRFIKEHSDIMLATYKRMEITVADETLVSRDANLRMTQVADLPAGTGTDSECRYTPRGLLRINPKHIDYLRDLVERYSVDESRDKLGRFDNEFKPTEAGQDFYHHHFDILIIHQGIIDKWFPNIAHDQKKIDLLFYGLRHVFPYVVITTGRGTPANVPDMARVLPFSTVETTMFKKYPEKLILVDAIMHLLPIRKT